MIFNKQSADSFLADAAGMTLGLEAMRVLMHGLGDPQDHLKFIHIAGTNGKGSVGVLTASALSACGYRVGRYSSPAVFEASETVTVDGVPIPRERYLEALGRVAEAAQRMGAVTRPPTKFEIETAVALVCFLDSGCDWVVWEVGLGGALDATNIVQTTEVAVFCSIGLDHCDLLGETTSMIAQQKSGIIKPHCTVVSAPCDSEVKDVLLTRACETTGVEMRIVDAGNTVFADRDGQRIAVDGKEWTIGLNGTFQAVNLAVALGVLRALQQRGVALSDERIAAGFSAARLDGRFQRIANSPVVYLDGAHNPMAAAALAQSLVHSKSIGRIFGVVGIFNDKDRQGIAKTLSTVLDSVFVFKWDNPRAADAEDTAKIFKSFGVRAKAYETLKEALVAAYDVAASTDTIVLCGSLSHLAEGRKAVEDLKNGR